MSADYTYNTTTKIGKVRLLIRDTTTEVVKKKNENYIFDDAEISNVFLGMNDDNVWKAAADACRALAADEISGSLRLELSGMKVDKSKIAQYWMDLADKFDAKSMEDDIAEFIDSYDHRVGYMGEDETEYVGDIV